MMLLATAIDAQTPTCRSEDAPQYPRQESQALADAGVPAER